MNATRFRLASVMLAIAVSALNLGVIRALHDTLEEGLLITALPTVNALAVVGIVGQRRRRLRAFAAGFLVAATGFLIGFHAWADTHPWTFLRYVEPLCNAIDRCIPLGDQTLHMAALYAAMAVVFLVPHAIAGLVGGGVAAGGWAIIARRRDRPGGLIPVA